jgi:putative oxidoreductase
MFRWLAKPDCAALMLRLMLASIFLVQGWLKVTRFDNGTTWYQSATDSMSPKLQAAVAWGELVCGAALALGLLTRLGALALIGVMVGAIYRVTWKLDFTTLQGRDQITHEVGYEYNFAIMTMCLCLVILGGGLVSLDHFLWGRKKDGATPAASAKEEHATASV